MTLLKVEDLKTYFPGKSSIFSKKKSMVYAVDGVSFSLEQGKTIGIVGESGCGKTTVGMSLLNLVKPTSGKIFFKGKNITDLSKLSKKEVLNIRKEMQIIFQDPYSSLNPRATLKTILDVPMKIHGIPSDVRQEKIEYLLEKVGLRPEHASRYPHEFSGGQRQRIGIARALSLNPSLIIGDEPVSALDVSIQAQIINLLIDLQDEFNLSYIIIAHDLAVVEHIADTIAVIYLGKIVEQANFSDLYRSPQHPYTQTLLSAIPIPDPHKKRDRVILKGSVPSPLNPPNGCSFHPRCPNKKKDCETVEPVLKTISPGHTVACHFA
ncbi:MAG: dipeptide ABC transporter ATP-binding protein [Deltaproteobacteria bacterium]|nr:dipeptide ABC transporter ATP-binding protein [Deltaproteobacteria bacterium]